MGIAQVHNQLLALLGHTIADAVDFQLLAEALGNAFDHVVNQGAGQAMEASVLFLIVGALHGHNTVGNLDDHIRMKCFGQSTLGALHSDHIGVLDGHFHACRYGDRHFANS